MIQRYSIKEIENIWSDSNRFNVFLKVELALLKTLEEFKIVPEKTHEAFKNVSVDPKRIEEIESITRHDVIAFCSSITEQVDPKFAKYFHFGVTSSDILDTALSIQIKESLTILLKEILSLKHALKNKVENTKDILCMGRSHGMYAEPMVFAQKFLSFYCEVDRRLKDYENIIKEELTGQFSGAVGNYTILSMEIETSALNKLGLKREPVSSQIIPRDHLAKIISNGSLLACLLERMSTEFRLLHHSDIHEISEGFKKGQKGSSTMPHKKNPISSENIAGISRIIKSHFEIASNNTNLWHERDISHSSAERIMLPDHFGLLTYITKRMCSTVENLEIDKDKIESKIKNNFSYLSSFILHKLIPINSCSRELLYEIVQKSSFISKSEDEFISNIQREISNNQLFYPENLSFKDLKNRYIEEFNKLKDHILIH